MSLNVLITCPHLQKTIDQYRSFFAERNIEVVVPPIVQQMSEAELLEIIDQFDGVIAGDDPFTAKVLEKGKRLKIVAKWGIGMDAIDRPAAERLGIAVMNTPDVFADEVGDVALGYIILLARQLHRMDRSVREGGWLQIPGITLRGKTLGVIGVGSIGRAIARRGAAVGMSVLGYDVQDIPLSVQDEIGLKAVGLEELLSGADFISLSCNLTAENHHLLSHCQFELMKPGVRLVNVARGPLMDEVALVAALESGKVAGAALDVFEVEPLPMESPLRRFDQCIFGTHNGSHTRDAVLRVNELAINNLLKGLELKEEINK
jgi:D-3-phosphoglycerate dehydrogenase